MELPQQIKELEFIQNTAGGYLVFLDRGVHNLI